MWRIYRLPGSRETWHIDSGAGTPVINVRGFDLRFVRAVSIDKPGAEQPRAWISVSEESEFFIINGIAVWEYKQKPCALAECPSAPCVRDAAESAELALASKA